MASDSIIRVYDRQMNKIAYLENAYAVGYELVLNELWTAKFSLPADDPKNEYCQPFNYVEIFDGGERVELFRIMPSTLIRSNQGQITYNCEHVLATLLDDVLFQYHQIGNIGVGTTAVLRYILDRQIEKKWQLGVCEFDRRFEYKWENENLLAALFSVPQTFNELYRWEFDTTGTVWRINLKRLPSEFKADVVYKKNMLEIQKIVDPTTIVTRLYCLGYGEGDNQLDITSVNNGIPYLESNGQTTTWGIKASILVDRRFESPETLKAYGQALLDQLKNPYKSYTTTALDLFRKSPGTYERFMPGDIIRVIDKEDGIIEDLPMVRVSKSDITGNPGSIEIEVANKSRDIAGSISELADRTRINEVYAQGATNQMIVPFFDNADPTNPATMRIYIPSTMARINKCILNYRLEAFRAYSKAIEGGGGTTQASSSGGGTSTTSGSGGGTSTTSGSGGGTSTTSGSGGGTVDTTSTEEEDVRLSSISKGDLAGSILFTGPGGTDGHDHQVENHSHYVSVYGHNHRIYIPSHEHGIYIPNHYHDIDIPNHNHSISTPNHQHNVVIPDHIHNLEFGIYEGDIATATTIKVDGVTIPNVNPGDDVDIIPYLSTDESGKILRDTWHEVEIIPNSMTRIIANIFMQIFTNSRGGGDF